MAAEVKDGAIEMEVQRGVKAALVQHLPVRAKQMHEGELSRRVAALESEVDDGVQSRALTLRKAIESSLGQSKHGRGSGDSPLPSYTLIPSSTILA